MKKFKKKTTTPPSNLNRNCHLKKNTRTLSLRQHSSRGAKPQLGPKTKKKQPPSENRAASVWQHWHARGCVYVRAAARGGARRLAALRAWCASRLWRGCRGTGRRRRVLAAKSRTRTNVANKCQMYAAVEKIACVTTPSGVFGGLSGWQDCCGCNF